MKNIKLLILITLLACGNLFANAVATITAIKGDANIVRAGEKLVATLGAKLQEKDNIITKDNTKLQIIFQDETIISIGKNSNFSIQEYVFDDKQEPIARFGMLKGAMRTITGKIGKIAPQKFSVATKTATIGIRGTNFSVIIGEDGSYNAFCTYGKISATLDNKVYIIQQGYFIDISPIGNINIKEFTPTDLKQMKKNSFSEGKKTKASKGKMTNNSKQNTEQLDVTKTDISQVTIADITELKVDSLKTVEALHIKVKEEDDYHHQP